LSWQFKGYNLPNIKKIVCLRIDINAHKITELSREKRLFEGEEAVPDNSVPPDGSSSTLKPVAIETNTSKQQIWSKVKTKVV
jgi:hypothetical protein